MARSVAFRPTAERDLERLYEYICERRGEPTIAIAYVRRIRAFCIGLATFPERGRPRADLRPGLRVAPVDRSCVVSFRIEAETVTIVRVFYRGRDYERILRKR
ncbi:type II toxin-antitoxin system RelE/ParE family toxin [Salinarimonas sp.]|uniref:type II toxin-antitoxin system RelE/ParE family toxin n=1 Tax=Salinarimonas sp. TaxID=2766526 RepID=UPI0032D92C8E